MDLAKVLSTISLFTPITVITIALVLFLIGKPRFLMNLLRLVLLFIVLASFGLFVITFLQKL